MRTLLFRLTLALALAAAGAVLALRSGLSPLTGALVAASLSTLSFAPALLRPLGTSSMTGAVLGAGAGLALAVLLRYAVPGYDDLAQPLVGVLVAAALAVSLGSLGLDRGGAAWTMPRSSAREPVAPEEGPRPRAVIKLVDTSVIIDGRVADVMAAGFLDGPIVIPQFVLRELQQVADSSDPLKRNRGRKGLDVLRAMQALERVGVEFTSEDCPEVREVDAKLLWLAERRRAKILTNDYNLNKVAQLRGIDVLNVNDLANAVRPVVLPGEPLNIQVIKEGKERNQGVGYLDDGTMVVVENGKRLMGQRVDVLVTSVIQTNAGKMIFATADDDDPTEVRPRVLRRTTEAAPLREIPPAPHVTSNTIGQG